MEAILALDFPYIRPVGQAMETCVVALDTIDRLKDEEADAKTVAERAATTHAKLLEGYTVAKFVVPSIAEADSKDKFARFISRLNTSKVSTPAQ